LFDYLADFYVVNIIITIETELLIKNGVFMRIKIVVLMSILFSINVLAGTDNALILEDNTHQVLGFNHLKKWAKGAVGFIKDYKDKNTFCKEQVFNRFSDKNDFSNKYTLESACEGGLHHNSKTQQVDYIVDDPKCQADFENFQADALLCYI
jgi:hypothetical protein